MHPGVLVGFTILLLVLTTPVAAPSGQGSQTLAQVFSHPSAGQHRAEFASPVGPSTSSFGVRPLSPTAAILNWSDSRISCFNYYQVSYNPPGFPSVSIVLATLADAVTSSWVATGLSPGGNYTWYGSVLTCAGTVPLGAPVTTTQPSVGTLSVAANGSTGVILTWTDPAGVIAPLRFSSYQVMESANASPFEVAASVANPLARSVGLTIDPTSTSYSFYLAARANCCGGRTSSWYSNTVDWNADGSQGWNVSIDPSLPLNVSPGVPLVFHCTERGFGPMFYNWTMGDGSTFRGTEFGYAYRTAGVYHARCVADRLFGAIDYVAGSSITVTVIDVSVELRASVTEAAPGNSVALHASSAGGSPPWTEFDWILPGNLSARPAGAAATVAWQTPGAHVATVEVVDLLGDSGAASLTITIAALAVTAGVNTSQTYVGDPIAFSASASGGAGANYSFAWSWGDSSAGGVGNPATHAYAGAGNFSASVLVSDPLGNQVRSVLLDVSIANVPTVAITVGSPTVVAGANVTLRAGFAGGFAPFSCSWQFGDGSSSVACATTHVYTAGRYAINLTVVDARGRTAITTLNLTVASRPTAGTSGLSTWELVAALVAVGVIVAAVALLVRRRRQPVRGSTALGEGGSPGGRASSGPPVSED
jgi:PKD domain-containing protein